MVTDSDIRRVVLTQSEMAYVARMAAKCRIGGNSHVRSLAERQKLLAQDQIIGMAGQLALCKYWFGSLDQFKIQRYFANLYPSQGDGGSDIPGLNVDIKTSSQTSPNILDYHLWVRVAEYAENTVYILGVFQENPNIVHLIGWEVGKKLVNDENGRYSALASQLNPLPPLLWDWYGG